jgi:hypothetical protein
MIASSPGGFTGLDYTMKTIAVGLEVVGVAVIVLGPSSPSAFSSNA